MKKALIIVAVLLVSFAAFGIYREKREAAQKKHCLNNLKQIDQVVNCCIPMEQRLSVGTMIPLDEFTNYMKHGLPRCLSGVGYAVPPVGSHPVCPVHGNLLGTNVHSFPERH